MNGAPSWIYSLTAGGGGSGKGIGMVGVACDRSSLVGGRREVLE